jgi:hypothetical protein
MVPDYSISHSEIFANGDTVAVFGSAQGTLSQDGRLSKENFWKTPRHGGPWSKTAKSPHGRSMPTMSQYAL